ALVGGRQSFQYQRRGRLVDVPLEPLRDDHRHTVRRGGAASDLSERRDAAARLTRAAGQATEMLQRTVSLLEATLDSTADGILVVDLEGRGNAFNRQFPK